MERSTLNAWLAGNLTLAVEADARGMLHFCEMIQELTLDQVRMFYGMLSLDEQRRREEATRPRARSRFPL